MQSYSPRQIQTEKTKQGKQYEVGYFLLGGMGGALGAPFTGPSS